MTEDEKSNEEVKPTSIPEPGTALTKGVDKPQATSIPQNGNARTLTEKPESTSKPKDGIDETAGKNA